MILMMILLLIGKKVQWTQSKSLRVPVNTNPGIEVNDCSLFSRFLIAFRSFDLMRLFSLVILSMQTPHVGLAKETHSPRFQAILRVTSGRKKKPHDIKSFSHELNSKGVRPFPVWRSRAVGHMEVSYYSLCLCSFLMS